MNTPNNSEKTLIGDALGFAYSSIFEHGFMGLLDWISLYFTIFAIAILFSFGERQISYLIGTDFFSNNFNQLAEGTLGAAYTLFRTNLNIALSGVIAKHPMHIIELL
jgi:hypothetical protein